MRLYVAGPMSGLPEYNYPAFQRVTARLRKQRFEVVCPTEICKHLGYTAHPTEYIRVCLPAVASCGGIVLLDGWERSKGARAEAAVALICGHRFYQAEPFMLIAAPTRIEVEAYAA